MKAFETWQEARIWAEEQVRLTGLPFGIEKPDPDGIWKGKIPPGFNHWTVRMLPGKRYRFGWECRCEAVEP